jgi:predicted dehydrogenase
LKAFYVPSAWSSRELGGRPVPIEAGASRTTDELVERCRWHTDQGETVLVVVDPGDGNTAELTGVRIDRELTYSEWFVAVADRPEAARMEGEFPVSARMCTLVAVDGKVDIAATTTLGLKRHPVLTVCDVGRGRIVTSGISDLDVLFGHPTLHRYLRRLLGAAATPQRTLGLAVVGYGPFGGMGYLHGLAAAETDGLAFVAAVDPDSSRRAAAVSDFAGLATYESADDVATDDAVDIAVVATPPVHHAALAIALLEAGKHVVVEKPMSLTVLDADRMIAAARANDRIVTVHQSRRWDPDFLALQHAVDTGLVGDVFNIETFVGGFEHPCRAWHSEQSVSGGAVFDWGSHHVDWILRLFGEPPCTVATTSHKRVWRDVTNADQVTVTMAWADGREATFRQSDLAAIRRPKFYVQGTSGTIEGHYRMVRFDAIEPGRGYSAQHAHHAEAPVDLRLVRYAPGAGLVEQSFPQPLRTTPWGFHRNLADHLLLGEPLAVLPEQSRAVVQVLEAAQQAGASGSAFVRLAAMDA